MSSKAVTVEIDGVTCDCTVYIGSGANDDPDELVEILDMTFEYETGDDTYLASIPAAMQERIASCGEFWAKVQERAIERAR